MFKIFTSLLLLCTSFSLFAQQCLLKQNLLIAYYQVEETQGKQTKSMQHINFYRHGEQIAYQHKEQGITEQWQLLKGEQVALNRYFDDKQRGIEYQPNELLTSVDWQSKYQLITDKEIAQMTLIAHEGDDCYQQSEYYLEKGNTKIRLTWLPQLKLVKRLQIIRVNYKKVWQLQTFDHDKNEVLSFFAQKDSYQMTDYADIGDNEADPFLAKMINQGFIEHLSH